MNPKLLMIIAFAFFFAWKKIADDFLLFCAVFAVALWVCVIIYHTESTSTVVRKKSR